MKFARKIFAAALSVAVLAACFAFATSAEAPSLPRENIRDVLEYRLYDTYLVETYEDGVGEYELDSDYFEFVTNNSFAANVIKDGDNNVLLMQNSSSQKGAGYKLRYEQGGKLTDLLTVSFDFKLGDAGATNGADFKVVAALENYVLGGITLFSANASDDSNKYFEYTTFNSDRAMYETAVMKDSSDKNLQVDLDTWYNVEIAINPRVENYHITLKAGDEVLFNESTEISSTDGGVNWLTLYVNDKADAGVTKTYLDNLFVLEGTYARDVVDPENSLADFIIAIDAYANSDISLDDKLFVAELYEDLFGKDGVGYTAPLTIEKYEEVDTIVKGAMAYVWQAKADAFIEYTNSILTKNPTYVTKLAYLNGVAKEYYEIFAGLDEFAGMEEEYNGVTYRVAVDAAIREYERAATVIENIKSHTENFIYIIENDYNPKSTDFTYIQGKYNQLTVLRPLVDSEYSYYKIVEDTKYPRAADAIVVYDALAAKLNAIQTNVDKFIPAVLAMEIEKASGVSAESPYLTTNFAELYENYLIAESVFENGTVHASLDPTTYPGLSEVIASYLPYQEYVEARLAETNNFVAIIKGAEASSYYVTIKSQIEAAALYLDTNVEKSLENIEGVAEAIELYYVLKANIEVDYENAQKYIAAVNAINMSANYTALKQAVNKALALQAKGSITGIDGIKEANTKLEGAVAKVNQLEAYSNTLITAVDALYEAETLAERRALIYTANSVRDYAEVLISGVEEALEILDEEIALYNEDVLAMNALFGEVVENAINLSNKVLSTESIVKANSAIIGAVK